MMPVPTKNMTAVDTPTIIAVFFVLLNDLSMPPMSSGLLVAVAARIGSALASVPLSRTLTKSW